MRVLTCFDWAVFSVTALIYSVLIRLLYYQTENIIIRFEGRYLATIFSEIITEIILFRK